MVDLDNIEKLANAASKGNWTAFAKGRTFAVLLDDSARTAIINWPGFDQSDTSPKYQRANVNYISAVQPSTILAMTARIRELERAVNS